MIAVRDLQIGDFINTENNGVVQITVLSWKGVGYEGGSSTPEHCSYIPLTSDILVKNGFKHSMPHNDWTNADCNFFLYEGGNGYRISNTDIKLDYVHQLQHLLRLCGVEKELTI